MMKKLLILVQLIILVACKPAIQNNSVALDIESLPNGIEVNYSGKLLLSQPFGFVKIKNPLSSEDSTLIITVHGYQSVGYEWIDALNKFSDRYLNLYFYRYDWNKCPDEIGQRLASSIDSLLSTNRNIDNLKIFGHSYGGLVVTYCAGYLDTKIPTEINTIASPLMGYPRIMDSCDLQYDDQNILQYPEWNTNITHHQWRTQKEQDGAFRELDHDPQDIYFKNSLVTVLPDSMNGHRLGHNWSVTWVVNSIFSNE